MCQEGGGVLDDVLVYRLEDGWGLVVNASKHRKIFSWLLQHRENFDADLHDQTDATAKVAVQRPRAISLGREIFANDPSALLYYGSVSTLLKGQVVLVSRAGCTG